MSETGDVRQVIEHELKTWPVYFEAVRTGEKRFEVRRADRDFQTGDAVRLREFDPTDDYSGRELSFRIGYVLRQGVGSDFVVFALEPLTAHPAASGWQQRIAAIDPWKHTNSFCKVCCFCGGYYMQHERDCLWWQAKQNAVDALPPAPEPSLSIAQGSVCLLPKGNLGLPPAPDAKDAVGVGGDWNSHIDAVHADIAALRSVVTTPEPDAKDANPPRDHDDLGRCQSCMGFQPVDALAEDRMANLFNAFADDVEQMSDEELIAEIVEDGGDPNTIAERTRRLLHDTVERFKAKQASEAHASHQRSRDDD